MYIRPENLRELVEHNCVHVFLKSSFGGRPEGRGVGFFFWMDKKSCLLSVVSPVLLNPALHAQNSCEKSGKNEPKQ